MDRHCFALTGLLAVACSGGPQIERRGVFVEGVETSSVRGGLPQEEQAPDDGGIDGDGTIRNGARLHGALEVATLHLPPSHIAYVTDDLTIRVRGDATIEGTLVAIRDEERRDAPDIRIVSGGFLCVMGVVHGAPGRGFTVEELGETGGSGTALWLQGSTVWVGGHTVSGPGGQGGGGTAGGVGGFNVLVGDTVPAGVEIPAERAAGIGASGGRGGPGTTLGGGAYMNGGDAGRSSVVGQFRTPEEASAAIRASLH